MRYQDFATQEAVSWEQWALACQLAGIKCDPDDAPLRSDGNAARAIIREATSIGLDVLRARRTHQFSLPGMEVTA